MAEWISGISLLEVVAVGFSVLYLVLAIRQIIWCWVAAFIGSVLSIFVFFDAQLFMQSALQVFYAAMAIYGWLQWSRRIEGVRLPITTWSWRRHLAAVAGVSAVSIVFAYGLSFTAQAMPWLDSFVTVAALLTTWMVAHKVFENWIYWFVIDSLSIYLYYTQELSLYAALFVVYIVLVVIGFRQWLGDLRAQSGASGMLREPA